MKSAQAELKELEGDDDAALVLKSQKIVGLMTSLQTVSSEAVNFMAMQAASGGELDSLLR